MIAVLFLLFIFLHGLVLSRIVLPKETASRPAVAFILGSIACVSAMYLVASLAKSLDLTLVLFFFISIQLLLIFKNKYLSAVKELKNIHWKLWILLCVL